MKSLYFVFNQLHKDTRHFVVITCSYNYAQLSHFNCYDNQNHAYSSRKAIEGPKAEVYKAMYGYMLKETAVLKTEREDVLNSVKCLHRVVQKVQEMYESGSKTKK